MTEGRLGGVGLGAAANVVITPALIAESQTVNRPHTVENVMYPALAESVLTLILVHDMFLFCCIKFKPSYTPWTFSCFPVRQNEFVVVSRQ